MTDRPLSSVQHLTVLEADEGSRLDRWLKRQIPGLTQGTIEKWVRKGQLRVDGKRVKANTKIQLHQIVRVPPVKSTPVAPKLKPMISRRDREMIMGCVVHQDEDLLVLNKPYGLAVQGGTNLTRHVDGLLDVFATEAGGRPKIVHRIDRHTTGLLVLARTRKMAQWLAEAFQNRRVKKTYWALTEGVPQKKRGTLDAPIPQKKEGGTDLEAVTQYKILQACKKLTAWIELKPLTGRTHQLRIHCKEMGTPILGDQKYGSKSIEILKAPPRLYLHARCLEIPLPGGGVKVFTASLPEHFTQALSELNFPLPD